MSFLELLMGILSGKDDNERRRAYFKNPKIVYTDDGIPYVILSVKKKWYGNRRVWTVFYSFYNEEDNSVYGFGTFKTDLFHSIWFKFKVSKRYYI